MKRSLTIFFQGVCVVAGIGVFVFMLWEPRLEGRNVHATFYQMYFNDPFLAYVYASSLLFFWALWEAYKVLGYVRRSKAFSPEVSKALRTVKYCFILLVGFVAGAESYMFVAVRGKDDIAGGVALGLFLILFFIAIAIGAAKLERLIRNRASGDSKDLTV